MSYFVLYLIVSVTDTVKMGSFSSKGWRQTIKIYYSIENFNKDLHSRRYLRVSYGCWYREVSKLLTFQYQMLLVTCVSVEVQL